MTTNAQPTDGQIEFIDITPTWTQAMPLLLAVIEGGTREGKREARDELMRLAKRVDDFNAGIKEKKS